MPIYLKYGEIKGDVTAEGHKGSDGWVEVNKFTFGIGRGISSPTGGSDDREASAPSVSEIVVEKPMDVSTVAWMEAALWGEGVDCTIDFVKTDKDKLETYAQYKLTNTMVSGYSADSKGDRPTETLTLNFTKFEFVFTQMGAAGAAGDAPRTGYDIGLAKKA